MAESKIIALPKVGEVLLERSYRAKHVNISVKPTKKVRVAVPVGVTFDRAHNFAKTKRTLDRETDSQTCQLISNTYC